MNTDKLQDKRRRPFYIIDNDIIDKYGTEIGVYGIAVYNLIARYADANGGNAFPSLSTITKRLGIGRAKAVETIQILVDVGLIHRENRIDAAGDAATNLYTLVDLGGSSPRELGGSHTEPPSSDRGPGVVLHGNQGSSPRELYKDVPIKTPKKKKLLAATAAPPETIQQPAATKEATEHQRYFAKVCEIVGWDYRTITKEQKGQVAQTVGILRDAKYTYDELCRFGKEVWVNDWRWIKLRQHPTLSQLRAEIGKLRNGEYTEAAKPPAPEPISLPPEAKRLRELAERAANGLQPQ